MELDGNVTDSNACARVCVYVALFPRSNLVRVHFVRTRSTTHHCRTIYSSREFFDDQKRRPSLYGVLAIYSCIYIRARSRIKRRRYAFRIVVDGCRAHSFLSLNPPLPSHDVRQFGRELLARARAAFCFFRTSPSVCVCVCTRHHTIAVDHTACLITGPPFVYGTKPIRPTYRVVDTGWGTEGDCSTGIVWIFRSGTKRDLIWPNVPIYGNFSRRTRTRNISLFESNNRIDFRSIPVHE